MKAMVFAAGLGTRLRPITDTLPKALAPVGDRTLLEICLDKLASEGYDDIVLNVHHFAEKMFAAVEAMRMKFPEMRISVSDESGQLLDTGGGVLRAEPLLRGAGPFLIHNVDIVSDARLARFHEAASALLSSNRECAAVLLVYDAPSDRKLLFDGDMRLVGWTDTVRALFRGPLAEGSPDGRTLGGRDIAEISAERGYRAYSFSGIHCVSDGVFDRMRGYGFAGAFPIMDFYLRAASDGLVEGIPAANLSIIDAGTPESLKRCGELVSRWSRVRESGHSTI